MTGPEPTVTAYEAPEVVELGFAAQLTLGCANANTADAQSGHHNDFGGCNC